MEQAIKSEVETVYTPLAKEAIAHFAQTVGIKSPPVKVPAPVMPDPGKCFSSNRVV